LSDKIKVLFIGDIIGDPGYNLTKLMLPGYVTKYKTDFVIANGENITEVKAFSKRTVKNFSSSTSMYLPAEIILWIKFKLINISWKRKEF